MTMTSWWQQFRSRFGRKPPPVIRTTIDGVEMSVTESARRQAAINLRLDPAKRAKVEEMIGEAKARANYPEAYR
jgi:hypothetical protein